MKDHLAGVKLVLIVLSFGFAVHASANDTPNVWFSPDNDTPDFIELFTMPEAWEKSRAHVRVFKFGPPQVESVGKTNSYFDLLKADAFRKLKNWRIDIAIEA